MNRRKLSILGAAGIAPFLVALLPAGAANAHGYISSPASRQAQCAEEILPCGPIKYEPQSVEGVKGQLNCSAGDPRWAELDDDTKPWQAYNTDGTVTFTWNFTARHRTLNYEYWIGNTRVAVIDGNNEPPPDSTVTHTIDLTKFPGRQKLIGIWNIADTPNAFYSCVDLQIASPS
ncbi:lytic polysaccharide monooxygenase auxiliary activity family 9 protein [Nocardia sp. NPDC088792]|uniref:lytic polysaccharide monooxygenase auxiliary activity family 9 protein n=1 Tax=Nocardia sp. NPDC088792 TaxID=3364332 RepID=UPI0037F1B824